jgi:hypothetical protein
VKASGPPQEVLRSHALHEVYHFPPPHVHADDHEPHRQETELGGPERGTQA